MWDVHTIEYYSTLKRKGILIHVTPWVNLEDITLSEIGSPKRTNTVWFHLHEVSRMVKVMETK